MIPIPAQLTLAEMQNVTRQISTVLESLTAHNIDLNGRRIINAGKSVSDFDYVTRFELDKIAATISPVVPLKGLLNAGDVVRVGAFASRGSPVAHANELFYASDLDYIGWLSTGAVWRYVSGVRSIVQADITTFTALLTTNDVGTLVNVTDYQHCLRWSGSALGWGPGEVGSGYYQLFEAAPAGYGTLAWQICDGSTVALLASDGTTSNVTVPDVSTARYLKGGTSSAAVAGYSGNTPTGTNSAPTFTGNAVAAASTQATPDLVAADISAAGVSPVTTATGTVSAPTFTGNAMSTLELPNKQARLYFRR